MLLAWTNTIQSIFNFYCTGYTIKTYNFYMSKHLPFHRFATWLSMLALVLNALMPLTAQAMLTSAGQVGSVEICTSTGMVRLPGDQGDDSSKSAAAHMQNCPFCLLHDGQASLPPVSVALPLLQGFAEMPPAFYQAADTSAVWLTALSRGPPLRLS